MNSWQLWAVLSAFFAALTAILAKVGVGAVNPDLATLVRTAVILALAAVLVIATGQWQPLGSLPGRTLLFLVLSGLATGASWLCYFRALKMRRIARRADRQAQRRHGRGDRGDLPRRKAVGDELARRRPDRGRRDPGGRQDLMAGAMGKGASLAFAPVRRLAAAFGFQADRRAHRHSAETHRA